MPAMPGSVRVAPQDRHRGHDHDDVDDQADVGEHPEQPVASDHEDDDQDHADDGGAFTGLDRVGAQPGADGALLEHGERCRQGAGAQQQGQVLGLVDAEVAGDDAGAAQDRLADLRGADHLVVEHDRQMLADVLAGGVAEALAADGVEAEGDHRRVLLERAAGRRSGFRR